MPNVWMAPGGRRELGEGVFECARREIREETGLEIQNLQIRATGISLLKDIDLELCLHFLTADYASGVLTESTEDGQLVWLTPEEIFGLDNLLAELRPVLPHVFSDIPMVVSYRTVYEKGNELVDIVIENP